MNPMPFPFDQPSRRTGSAPTLWVMLSLIGLMIVSSTHAQMRMFQPIIQRVVILGLSAEKEAAVREAMPISLDEPLMPDDLKVIEAKLSSMEVASGLQGVGIRPYSGEQENMGDGSSATSEDLELVLDFRPPPTITDINIYSLVDIKTEKFRAVCRIKPGDIYDQKRIDKAIAAMQEVAEKAGIGKVEIKPHHRFDGDSKIALGFIVEGNSFVELHKLRFNDAGWGNAAKIRTYFKERDDNSFDKGSEVTARILDEVEKTATELMHSQGYIEARVRLLETSVSEKGARVFYQVDRGPRYRFGASQVTGNRFPDSQFWQPGIERFDTRYVTSKRIREFEDSVKDHAKLEGYMEPTVDLDFVPTPEKRTMAVVAHVDEGTTSTLANINIDRRASGRGYGKSWYHRHIAPPLSESIIRKQIRVREGEPLNGRALLDAERRLWRLGTFEEVKVDTSATTNTMMRDINVDVTEKRTAGMDASLGWNDQIGPVARLSFSEANVGGRADQMALNGWWSLNNQGMGGDISYLDRYWKPGERWLGKDREPSMLYYLQYDELGFSHYSEKHAGGRVRLSYLTGESFGPWSNSWYARVEKISYNPYGDKSDYDEDFDSYLATTLAYHITYDTRDRGDLDSTEGLLLDTGLEIGSADGFLAKWTNTAEWHKRLSRRFGWVSIGQLGLMAVESTKVGLADRFQAGGLGSIRGFDYRGIGPVDGETESLHIGGSTMSSIQNELRYYINDNITLPVFFDIGTLEKGPFRFGSIRASTGLGLRIKLPETNQDAYIYFAEGLSGEDTDQERSIHFGMKFGL